MRGTSERSESHRLSEVALQCSKNSMAFRFEHASVELQEVVVGEIYEPL